MDSPQALLKIVWINRQCPFLMYPFFLIEISLVSFKIHAAHFQGTIVCFLNRISILKYSSWHYIKRSVRWDYISYKSLDDLATPDYSRKRLILLIREWIILSSSLIFVSTLNHDWRLLFQRPYRTLTYAITLYSLRQWSIKHLIFWWFEGCGYFYLF